MKNELGISIIHKKLSSGTVRVEVVSEVAENKVRHIGGVEVDRIKNKGHVSI